MPYLRLKTSDGDYANFPIYNPIFSEDGYLAFFEAHIKNFTIFTTGGDIKTLGLKRTDMSAEDWVAMLGRIGSVGTAGAVLGGPIGIVIGGFVGLASFVRRRPSQDGYYLLSDKENDNCVLPGKIHRSANTFIQ